MTATGRATGFGRYVFGAGIVALGLVFLAFRDFAGGQIAPDGLPARAALACVVGVFLVAAGAAMGWRRTAAWGAGALTAYYAVVVVVLMDGLVIAQNVSVYGAYSGAAEELAIAAAGLIVFAANARIDAVLAARLTRIAQLAFGVCAVLFGGAHFAYMTLTAPLVPRWLPPSPLFWGYATGIFHIAGGIAILTGVRARLAAILLTVMYAAFTPLVHIPTLFADPHRAFLWSENALNLALVGVAWVVADSLRPDGLAPGQSAP